LRSILPNSFRGSGVAETWLVLLLALAVTALPIGAHVVGQVFGIGLCVGLAFLVANFAASAVPATLLCAFLFQNVAVSLVTPWISGPAEFNTIRGYNFLTTGVMWLVLSASYWSGERDRNSTSRRLMIGTSGILGLIVLYFLIGAIADARSAAIYLRNVAMPLLVFQAGLIAASRSRGNLVRTLTALAALALLYGYAELLVRPQLFSLINGDTYLGYTMRQQIESGIFLRELKETGRVVRGIEDMMKIDLFNTPLLSDLRIRIDRLQGPNFNPISFGYALAILSLFRLAAGRPLYGLAALPLLLVIGSKGALVLFLLSGAALAVFGATRNRAMFALVVGTLALYAAAAIVLGLGQGDYHVVGLFGGINGFLKNPFGHGLGAGGNLSMDMTRIDWSRSQALGQTDFAVESAVGVLLFQMGVAGFAVWLTPFAVAWTAWKATLRSGRIEFAAAAFGLLVVATNGLLQEEALFAPLALASVMLFAALAFGEQRASADAPAGTAIPVWRRPGTRGVSPQSGELFQPR